jgi:hypothetical protein
VANGNYVMNELESSLSDNAVKVAQLGAREKLTPFVCSKFTDRSFGIASITDNYELALSCNPNALAAFASA